MLSPLPDGRRAAADGCPAGSVDSPPSPTICHQCCPILLCYGQIGQETEVFSFKIAVFNKFSVPLVIASKLMAHSNVSLTVKTDPEMTLIAVARLNAFYGSVGDASEII